MRQSLGLGLLLLFASAFAGTPRPDPVVILQKDIALRTVYAWERWGNFLNAVPGDGQQIPYDAAQLQVRVYAFSVGQIRVITFNKGVRTHDHVNMTDTLDYTWTGRRVVIANGRAAITLPGDASFHPKGVFHHGEALESGFGLEFAVEVDHSWNDPQATWLSAASRPIEPAAVWKDRGTVHGAYGDAAAAAPATAARFTARTFDFPPYYAVRELRVPQGTVIAVNGPKDRLMLLLDGQARVRANDQSWGIGPQDAICALAGRLTTLDVTTDAVIVEADIPPKGTSAASAPARGPRRGPFLEPEPQ